MNTNYPTKTIERTPDLRSSHRQPLVTCTYCTQVGTLHYTHKPVFQCSNCKKTPILPNIEREVNQAMSQPSASDLVNPTTPFTTPFTTTATPKNVIEFTVKIVSKHHPQRKPRIQSTYPIPSKQNHAIGEKQSTVDTTTYPVEATSTTTTMASQYAQPSTGPIHEQASTSITLTTTAITTTNKSDPSYHFEYVYFPSKHRTCRKIQRENLRTLGADNGRILNITYPAKTVVGFFVHKMYSAEIIRLMKTAGVKIIKYDPTDGKNLTSPDFAHHPSEVKNTIAREKHNERIARALFHIRLSVAKSVALFFHKQQWITDEELTDHITSCNNRIKVRSKKHNTTAATTNNSNTNPNTQIQE
ncbi:MAG: hypothetical protein EXX96DRAFT_624239 [Benjaminiella poitrasii]|nr:MAG: hypothetical protein EXX96DRAFT_624239 [Benjaminiella poitrasii]